MLLFLAGELRVMLGLVMDFLPWPRFRFAYGRSSSDEENRIDTFFANQLHSVAQHEQGAGRRRLAPEPAELLSWSSLISVYCQAVMSQVLELMGH